MNYRQQNILYKINSFFEFIIFARLQSWMIIINISFPRIIIIVVMNSEN